ncbi:Hypp1866 [Branchiostoma lanceolatum]|uniref:Hypp1866 protein n=1 Tax=Branchiostoma lanceolatum TaxID=7740 RepID=A0A8J9ZP66_BRALA|nr:Hypp1866 [Branchiostoma lanceolatum]
MKMTDQLGKQQGADDSSGNHYLHRGEVEDAEQQEAFPTTTVEREVLREVITAEVTAILKKAWPRLFPGTSSSMLKRVTGKVPKTSQSTK